MKKKLAVSLSCLPAMLAEKLMTWPFGRNKYNLEQAEEENLVKKWLYDNYLKASWLENNVYQCGINTWRKLW